MKGQYARDLIEGTKVDAVFALRARDIRLARTGDAYLSVELADRSGSTPGVMFRPSTSDEAIPVGTVVRVRGTVTAYRGVRRVSIDSLRPEADFESEDLLPASARERSELVAELRALVRSVVDRPLRRVLGEMFGAPGFIERFATCPASPDGHHAYIGGLLEHTVSVASICSSLARAYPVADRDLLVSAALLHDVGTVEALEFQTAVALTDEGRLLGHVALGERLVAAAIARLGDTVPRAQALRLAHAILSHHHVAEDGGSRPPCSVEALLLRDADGLDLRMAEFADATAGAAILEERWSDPANVFGRPLLVPQPRMGCGVPAADQRCA